MLGALHAVVPFTLGVPHFLIDVGNRSPFSIQV
jgi:hypothetical protein